MIIDVYAVSENGQILGRVQRIMELEPSEEVRALAEEPRKRAAKRRERRLARELGAFVQAGEHEPDHRGISRHDLARGNPALHHGDLEGRTHPEERAHVGERLDRPLWDDRVAAPERDQQRAGRRVGRSPGSLDQRATPSG